MRTPLAAAPASANAGAFGIAGTPLHAWQASQALAAVPPISLAELIPSQSGVIVVAPHPDDENLGCGGLLAGLAERNHKLTVVAVTDGEGSHPQSPLWSADRLRATRRQESLNAMARLGFADAQVDWQHLALPDGQVAAHLDRLRRYLEALLRPGDRVLSTWRRDGHCDHEAVGAATAECARRAQAQLIEVPVWAWHWAAPRTRVCPGRGRANCR